MQNQFLLQGRHLFCTQHKIKERNHRYYHRNKDRILKKFEYLKNLRNFWKRYPGNLVHFCHHFLRKLVISSESRDKFPHATHQIHIKTWNQSSATNISQARKIFRKAVKLFIVKKKKKRFRSNICARCCFTKSEKLCAPMFQVKKVDHHIAGISLQVFFDFSTYKMISTCSSSLKMNEPFSKVWWDAWVC